MVLLSLLGGCWRELVVDSLIRPVQQPGCDQQISRELETGNKRADTKTKSNQEALKVTWAVPIAGLTECGHEV